MSRGASTALSLPLIAAALLIGAPAHAQEQAADVDVPAARLDRSIRLLSRQIGASIGFRDSRLATQQVKAVRGKFTAAQALERMFLGTRLVARRVATSTYLIEYVPVPERSVARPAPRQPAALPDETITPDIVVTGSTRRSRS